MAMRNAALLAVLGAMSLACGSAPVAPAPAAPPVVTPPPVPEPPPAPTLRLSEDVVPRRYALELTIIPTATLYSGAVDIDVDLTRPLSGLWLHAEELEVSEAFITVGKETLQVKPLPRPAGDDKHLGLGFGRELPAGPAHLRLVFSGKLQVTETRGLFKQQDGDSWYAYSHFETTDASLAFPCFDDPRWKTPWRVTLHVKQEDRAFSGSPVETETPEAAGLKTVVFAETKPLPTYLVSMAVGPFEIVDGGTSRRGAPVRILALKGRSGEAAYAAEVTAKILTILEDYFDTRYPFEKVDSVAVPETVGFSAMENPGLITYNDGVLLARPEDDTVARRRRYAGIAAHELAHMWFGDSVTLAWWDDTWLNESFASWAASKVIEELEPTWGETLERVRDRSRALSQDVTESTRAIRQPIKGEGDIENAFDRITYAKGQAVLEMFEAWLGPDVWREGVRRYVRAHAYGSATANDFFAAIGEAAGRDVSPVLSTFIDQAGAPLVIAGLECPAAGKPRVTLAQERYTLNGAAASPRSWKIPVCVHSPGGRVCTVLEKDRDAVELPDASCPAWIYPNAGGSSYYRSELSGDLRERLVKVAAGALTTAEQISFLGDLGALELAGRLGAGDALAALPRLQPARNRHLVAAAIAILNGVRRNLITVDLEPRYARYVNKLFGARARQLGFVGRAGESEDDRLLRAEIVPQATVAGRDARLASEARRLALRWLADPRSLPPDSVRLVLRAAAGSARAGDRALVDGLVGLARDRAAGARRDVALDALGFVEEPGLVTVALGVFLDDKIDIREVTGMFRDIMTGDNGATRLTTYKFIRDHYDRLSERLPKPGRRYLLLVGLLVCTDEDLADYQAQFGRRVPDIMGGERLYQQTLEGMKACVAERKAQRAGAASYLQKM